MTNEQKNIPNIKFEPKSIAVKGIEIIKLQDLIKRREQFDHNPEKAHQLTFNLIMFYTKGESEHLVDFVKHEVKTNSVIYVSKGQVHAYKFTEGLEGFLIPFTEDYFEQQINRLPKEAIIRIFNSQLFSPKIQVPENSNVRNYINLLYDEFHKETNAFNKANIINYLFNIIFSKLENLKKHQTLYLKESDKLKTFLKFKRLLEKGYQNSRNADFYAERLNITYKHLNEISKEVVNITAKQFIDEFIILEAKRQLINSEIKSTELAFSMGFEEPTNFVKYFKKNTGFTPNQYKKLNL